MKTTLALFIFTLMLFGCMHKPKNELYDIINDNFLVLVDTLAYRTGKLILNPNDSNIVKSDTERQVSILIDTAMDGSEILYESVSKELEDENLKEFRDLLFNTASSTSSVLEVANITRTGSYILVPTRNHNEIGTSFAGKISFAKPFIKKNKAILIFSVSDTKKSGRSVVYFLKKDKKQWNIFEKIELERW